ncbi:MAG: dephospho-CoA kinase [Agarilytica sp.]
MFCVGLTGGIGSGKTTVTDLFHDHGITIVDTDVIAREIVEPGSESLIKIATHFGPNILTKDGSLNRKALRDIIFSSPEEKLWLESLMHPIIREKARSDLKKATSPYVILSSPLLLESPDRDLANLKCIIDVTQEQQIERTAQRDGVNEAQIRKTIATQIPRGERLKAADDIIDNSGSVEETQKQVNQLHQKYLQLSESYDH